MAGLKMATGFNGAGSVVGGLYSGYGGAAVPAASTVPEGPVTITQQAFGVPPAGMTRSCGLQAAGISTGALALLILIWWALPR
jgi:hypothetical protein